MPHRDYLGEVRKTRHFSSNHNTKNPSTNVETNDDDYSNAGVEKFSSDDDDDAQ